MRPDEHPEVVIPADQVAHLRSLLAVVDDETGPVEDRRGATLQVCGFLEALLGSGPERFELGHAGRAADHVLALVVAQDPTFRVTPEHHDAMAALVQAVARAVAAGGVR